LKILKFFVPKRRALELEKASRNIENWAKRKFEMWSDIGSQGDSPEWGVGQSPMNWRFSSIKKNTMYGKGNRYPDSAFTVG
jgi:hypothetical protein